MTNLSNLRWFTLASLVLFVFAYSTPVVFSANNNIAKCFQAVTQCKKSGQNCIESLKNDGERCGDVYDKTRLRCQNYQTRGEKLLPACQIAYDRCDVKAVDSSFSTRAEKLAKCADKLATCRDRANDRIVRYLISKNNCLDKAKTRKEDCDSKYRFSYPSRVTRCTSRMNSCLGNLGNCL